MSNNTIVNDVINFHSTSWDTVEVYWLDLGALGVEVAVGLGEWVRVERGPIAPDEAARAVCTTTRYLTPVRVVQRGDKIIAQWHDARGKDS